jgi:hypothetical protein
MTELPTPEQRKQITNIVDRFYARMMEALDETDVSDEGIIAILDQEGYAPESEMFQEWIADEDPARDLRQKPDPEGPGPGVVPDPPNPSYEPLVAQLDGMRKATGITYEWQERERMMYSCRATVNRSQLQTWLNANVDSIITPEEVDAETLVEFLEANPGASIDERRWPAESSETDFFELRVVQP